jgi:hypothetical protein
MDRCLLGVDIHGKDVSCIRCTHCIPHDTVQHISFCDRKKELVVYSEKKCENFEKVDMEEMKKSLRERGWVYCLSCSRPVFLFEDLNDHIGDIIVQETFSDDVASEDNSSAD